MWKFARALDFRILLRGLKRLLNLPIGIILILRNLKLFWGSFQACVMIFKWRWRIFILFIYFRLILFQLSNAKYYAATAGQKIADHKLILILLSANNIAGLQCLLAAALCHGASAYTICGLFDHAISDLYLPQSGFTNHDLDIALLVKSIGGPHLLYTLQKSQGFASWRTVGCHHKISRLFPSIGILSVDEINSKIAFFFDPSAKPQPTPVQNSSHRECHDGWWDSFEDQMSLLF